jgi:RimJ/RimL family protein N-acetyltransferase
MNFNFYDDYILQDDIVLLRPLIKGDFAHLLEYSINEPEIWRFSAARADGAENLKKYIENAVKQRETEKEYPFIVFDKRVNKYIGSTRFYDIQIQRKTIQLGYTWYGKSFQGTGINKNCKFLLFDFALIDLDMERVGLAANIQNEWSINALKSIGCIVEGVLRNYSCNVNGDRSDSVIFSILKSEWKNELKEKLKSKLVK